MTKRKLLTSGQKRIQPSHRKPFAGVSRLTSGVKDRAIIERGFGGVLEAALNVWLAKRNIVWSEKWGSKKK